MGATEAELRREADEQRARMGETLEAIGDRISPERMYERRKAAMGLRFQRIKESVMGSPGYEEPMSRRLGERTGDAAHAVGDTARTAAESVQHAPQMVADQARGNPVAAGLVAFGAGMLAATVMPRSRTEQRLVQQVQPQLQHAKEELAQAGREVATDAKEHAREAADELKSVGNEAAGHMREQAQSSARTVTEEARREQRS